MIYLSLGSNLGNRFNNLRRAVVEIGKYFNIQKISHVVETKALLKPNSPRSWDIPHLNMVLAGNSALSPFDLLRQIKNTEKQLGRDMSATGWPPRIIDIDILIYHDEHISEKELTIPHKEIVNRDFVRYLLKCLGFSMEDSSANEYKGLNYFVLEPKFIKIINVTPDSFSDGGQFFAPPDALHEIIRSYKGGAAYVELGAQSTRPGYAEISPQEEIKRLAPILEAIPPEIPLSIDSYFDEVVEFCLKHANVQMVNTVKFGFRDDLLKKLSGKKVVAMMHGMNTNQLKDRINHLKNLGIENVVADPGIGFGKTKFENLEAIKHIEMIKSLGCEVMLAHSRKSFIDLFSNAPVTDRDTETLAVSNLAAQHGINYLRIHNLDQHMRFFTTQKILQL